MKTSGNRFLKIPVSLKNEHGLLHEYYLLAGFVGVPLAVCISQLVHWNEKLSPECSHVTLPWIIIGIMSIVFFGGGYFLGVLLGNRD